MKNFIFVVTTFLLPYSFFAQTLIMNEVSNGPSGNQEYVEFVVIDTAITYNCNATTPPCINIQGWIFDDNSGYHGTSGIAAGAVRFSFDPMWACVPLGTIIVIYNDADPNTQMPANDLSLSDGNCKIIAPIGNTQLFERNPTTPGAVACSYPATGWIAGGAWSNTLLANPGDCARIVNLAGCEVFSVCWGAANLNALIYFNSGGSGSQNVWSFNNGDPQDQANWTEGSAAAGGNQTPGAPNNAANAAYIYQFNNGCLPIPPITVTATSVNAGCTCTGTATATATGSIPGYTYAWYNATFTPIGQTAATATGLCAGTYHVIATSSIGCSDTATVTITSSSTTTVNVNNQTICAGNSTTLTATPSITGGTFSWSPGGQTTQTISVNPSTTTTYTVTYTLAGCTSTGSGIVTVNPLPIVTVNDISLCATATGTLTATGATTYSWSPASFLSSTTGSSVTFTPGSTTTYTITGTGSNGCVNTDIATVSVLPNAPINAGPDVAICSGGTTTLNATGGVTYTWDNGLGIGNGFSVSPAATTTYTVIGTDAVGCVGTDAVTVTVNPLPVVNAGIDQTICGGTSVTLSGSGATSYSWSGGITNGVSFVPSATATYTLTGTTAAGCTATDIVTINVNPLPTVIAGNDQTICAGTALTLNGSGATTYSWSGGITNGIAFVPSSTTTYTLTGTSAAGCTATDQVTITVNPLPIVNAGTDQTICAGTSVTLSATGATTYSWNNGVTNGVTFTPAATTTYTVTGTSAAGCINTDQVIVTVNPLPTVNAGLDQTVCVGTSVTLSGSGAATYTWNNGVTNGIAFTPAATTTYTVTGTSATGCINTDQVVVTVNPLPTVNAGADQTICVGATVTLSASGALSYSWNNSISQGVAFTPISSATYTVIGTDINGCTNTDQVIVTVNPLPIVSAGVDQTVCSGSSITLSGSGASTYSWNNGATNGIPLLPVLGTTTYTVTGTSAAGCIATDQVVIFVNPIPNPIINGATDYCVGFPALLSTSVPFTTYNWSTSATTATTTATIVNNPITVTVTNSFGCSGTSSSFLVNENLIVTANSTQTICQGQSAIIHGISQTTPGVYSQTFTTAGCDSVSNVTLIVNPLPIVNAGPDQVVCSPTATALTATGAATYTWNNSVLNGIPFTQVIGTTSYTVSGTDANGCVNSDQVLITVNPLPAVIAGPDQTICTGTSVSLNASGANTYVWNNGVSNTVPFTPIVTSSYTVTGTDLNGCVNSDLVLITVNPLPIVNAGPDQTICIGASTSVTGGGASTYSWNNGVTNGLTFSPAATNNYTVVGTDVNGCINSDQLVITVNPLPLINAGADQLVCTPSSITLNGSGGTSYSWNNGVTNAVAFTPAIGTTVYTLTGTDINGCVNSDQVSVTVYPLPTVNAGPDQAICAGTVTSLSGSGALNYNWNNGITNNGSFTPVLTNTYTVTGTDANGCTNTDQVTITVNPLPTVNAGNDQIICEGTSINLTATGALNYTWSNALSNGSTFTPTATATYTVIGTDVNGCENTDQLTITVDPLPLVNAGNDQTICEGTSITLAGAGANNYSWNNGALNNNAFIPAVGSQTFTVTGTSANGCVATDQVTITVNPLPTINAGPDQAICLGAQVVLSGTGATTLAWTGGITNNLSFNPTVTTMYTLTGTSADGCVNQDNVTVTVNALPSVFAGNDLVICEGSTVVLSASGATSYSWDNGIVNGQTFTPPMGSSTYTVTGTNNAGCVNTDQVLVTVEPAPIVSFVPDQTTGCTPLTVNFTNTTANTSDCIWTINNGTTINGCDNVSVTFTQGGCYDITLSTTSANGCTGSSTVLDLICVEDAPIAAFDQSTYVLSEFNPSISFQNNSIGANQYTWDFGDHSTTSQVVNPIHDYSTTELGSFEIALIASSAFGCVDTAYSTVIIEEELIYYVPNTFTPDNDNYNQIFKPVFTSGFDPFDYTLLIFNRWGEIIFESHNTEVGWDGTYGQNSEIGMVQDGTYTWKIEFKTSKNDKRIMEIGHVNVLK